MRFSRFRGFFGFSSSNVARCFRFFARNVLAFFWLFKLEIVLKNAACVVLVSGSFGACLAPYIAYELMLMVMEMVMAIAMVVMSMTMSMSKSMSMECDDADDGDENDDDEDDDAEKYDAADDDDEDDADDDFGADNHVASNFSSTGTATSVYRGKTSRQRKNESIAV